MNTEQKRAFIINFMHFLIYAVLFLLLIKYLLPMAAPFVLAFVVAWFLQRPLRFIRKKIKIPHKPLAIFLVLLFYCTIGSLIGLLVIRAFWGITSLMEVLPRFYSTRVEPAFTDLFFQLEKTFLQLDPKLVAVIEGFDDQFMQWLGTFISGISSRVLSVASNVATSVPGLFLKLVLMIISTFFIAIDYETLAAFCIRQLSPKSKNLFWQIKKYLVNNLLVCIGSYAVIMTLTFAELSIGLTILNFEHSALIAACIAIFDILPVLGTGGIMIPWALLTMIRGDVTLGLWLLLLYVIITIIRNIVEPKIVGTQLGLHPVVTLSSMFIGVQLLGVVGLFGFPIGLSLLCYLNDNGSIHIFKPKEAIKASAKQPDKKTNQNPKISNKK